MKEIWEIIERYLDLWFITIPLTYYIVFEIGPELLDLILNTTKINRLLHHSDNLDTKTLEKAHYANLEQQKKVNASHKKELEFQMAFKKLNKKNQVGWGKSSKGAYQNESITAKRLLDIFKIESE